MKSIKKGWMPFKKFYIENGIENHGNLYKKLRLLDNEFKDNLNKGVGKKPYWVVNVIEAKKHWRKK